MLVKLATSISRSACVNARAIERTYHQLATTKLPTISYLKVDVCNSAAVVDASSILKMYPLSRSFSLRCFHCSNIPFCSSNAFHYTITSVSTLRKRGIHKLKVIPLVPGISTPVDHGHVGLSIDLSHPRNKLRLRDTSDVKFTNSGKSRGSAILLHRCGKVPSLFEDNGSSQSRFFSTSQMQTQSFDDRKYNSSRAKYKSFVPHKMLVIPKVTRFMYEKGRFPQLSENELRCKVGVISVFISNLL